VPERGKSAWLAVIFHPLVLDATGVENPAGPRGFSTQTKQNGGCRITHAGGIAPGISSKPRAPWIYARPAVR
jgi:hypothetical protein